jgi:D-sedoheptulose 7-phosphate isomerase
LAFSIGWKPDRLRGRYLGNATFFNNIGGRMPTLFKSYAVSISKLLDESDWDQVEQLAQDLFACWDLRRQVFLCGNGGSAGNAIHLANDLLYGIASQVDSPGMRIEALTANSAVLTCLANDIGYEEVFSEQIRVKALPKDLLIVLSGSGNSENVVRALKTAKDRGVRTCAILGFSGGQCLTIADHAIHFPVDDMQIAEDLQLIVGHMCMQYLSQQILETENGSIV